ncbi:MAG: glycine zipper 2TM domain-containing protein [Burkholderiaceae bacterium]|nr:glycine zipper 2TM domain-containing protein [Burkholderiaceae bacterium]
MNSSANAPIATQAVFSRPAALIGGALGLVALTAIATTLALRSPVASEAGTRGASSTPTLALSALAAKAPPEAPADFPEKVAPAAPAIAAPAPRAVAAQKPVHVQRGSVKAPEPSQRAASVCATCGKVESVSAVKQKGQGTGLGVVGGAVVGGLLGSQVGGGSGKNVATVLGAVGGGVAGNEVEKRARGTTVYQVHVRMDDGSLRTVTQSTAPAVGQKVTVEGSTLRARAAAS